MEYNQLAPTSSGANDFYPQKTHQRTSNNNSRGLNLKEDMSIFNSRDKNVNFTRMPSTSRGGNNFLGPQRTLQRTNEKAFPTQKRDRSELLSLFGGRSRVVPHQQQEGHFSNETIAPPQQNFPIVRDFDNISQKKPLPTTNKLFSQAFDISLGDEDDFSDTSFQSLYNPESKTNASSKMTSQLSDQPWHSDETDVIDVDEYLEAEIDNVLSDYDDNASTTNNFAPVISKLNSLPLERSNKSQVTRGSNGLIDEHFDEEMDDVAIDDDFGMFNTCSTRFRNPNVNSTCTPGRECGVSRVGVARNVLVNEQFDPKFDFVLNDDDYADELAMFRTSSGKPKPVERGQSSNFPSTSRSFLQNRLHSSSRGNQFTPPLAASVNNNPRTSSSYQQDCRSSNIEHVTVGTSLRPVSAMKGLVPFWSNKNESWWDLASQRFFLILVPCSNENKSCMRVDKREFVWECSQL